MRENTFREMAIIKCRGGGGGEKSRKVATSSIFMLITVKNSCYSDK